jgi:short-subunit dehydrogenase
VKLGGAHVAIVGGTGGVGAALARRFVEQHVTLSLLARDDADLPATAAETGATAYPIDLSEVDQLAGVIDRIEARGGPIDVLVCNAAISPPGPFQDLTADQLRSAITVNMLSHMELTRQVLPGMIDRRGAIVTMGSLSSEVSMIHLSSYVPSKAGLTKWAVDLQSELRDYGIRVYTFVLGSVKGTELANSAITDPVVEFIEKRSGDAGILTPEVVATRIVDVVATKQRSGVVTIPMAAAPLVGFRHLPTRLTDPILGRLARKKKREFASH